MLDTDISDGPPYGLSQNGTTLIFYQYLPDANLAYAFGSLFAITTIANIALLCFRPRPWYCVPLIIGGTAESFGYFSRANSHQSPTSFGSWMLQNLLLLLAGPLVAATMYSSLRRLSAVIMTTLPSHLRYMSAVFIVVDAGCLASHLIGAIVPVSGHPDADEVSEMVLLGGLVAELVALTVFFGMTMEIHQRVKTAQQIEKMGHGDGKTGEATKLKGWRKFFRSLEIMAVLLAVRSLVRYMEYAEGTGGFVASHEVFIYLFDAVPVCIILILFVVLHPQRLVQEGMKHEGKDDDDDDEV